MKAHLTYTAPAQTHTHIRVERIPVSGGVWAAWETVATGDPITDMPLANSNSAFDIRFIAVDSVNSRESAPSSVIRVSYADGEAYLAAQTPALPPLNPPTPGPVTYLN